MLYHARFFFMFLSVNVALWLVMHSLTMDQFKESLIVQPKICIVMGMNSRSVEMELRQLQRAIFNEFAAQSSGNDVSLHLFFAISKTTNLTIMDKLNREQSKQGNILLLDVEEKYDLLTAKAFELFRNLLPYVTTPECRRGYIIKLDTDVLVGYKTLVQAVKAMPSSSVYFGQMLPNTPLTTQERYGRESARSFLPMWAVGTMYGFSRDVVEKLISTNVMNTVWKPSNSYIFREEDRAIGLALSRGRVNVRHYLYLHGIHSFCNHDFSCDRYHHAVAFSVGFGLSGESIDLFEKKKNSILRFRRYLAECNLKYKSIPPGETLFFEANGNTTFEKMTHSDVMQQGCHKISPEGEEYLILQKNLNEAAKHEMRNESSRCAEQFYLRSYPEVMKLVESGMYRSARDHYLQTGWKNFSFHFFCPEGCEPDQDCTLTCDKEEAYLKAYPDVAKGVAKGQLSSGIDHYTQLGKHEQRSYSCYQRHVDTTNEAPSSCYEIFREFILESTPFVSQWPIHGTSESYDPSSSHCKALVFIDGRDHEWMDFVLREHRRYTGPDWMFYLIGPPNTATNWQRKYEGTMVKVIELPQHFGNLSVYPDQYNALLTSEYLWKEVIECEYVLVTQADSLLLRHGIEDFFDFSYVGSPLFPESFPSLEWRLLYSKSFRSGGNGGLSFRRKSHMIKALEECPYPKTTDEDVWFSSCMQNLGLSLPHPKVANRFSTGSKCEVDAPFGVHKMWQNCGDLNCAKLIVSSRLFRDVSRKLMNSNDQCITGETLYRMMNPDVNEAIRHGHYDSAWQHFSLHGKDEGRNYECFVNPSGISYRNLEKALLQL